MGQFCRVQGRFNIAKPPFSVCEVGEAGVDALSHEPGHSDGGPRPGERAVVEKRNGGVVEDRGI